MVQPNMGLVPEQAAGIDPALYEQQAAGMAAANQLRNLTGGARMADALRQSQTPLMGVQGRGLASQGPTFLNALGTLAQRAKGRQRLDDMDRQAAALRGQMESGRMAELKAQDARSQQAFERNRQLADEARSAASKRIVGTPQEWSDENGNKKVFVMSGAGPVHPVTKEPVDLEGYSPPEQKGYSRYGAHFLNSKGKTDARGAFSKINAASRLKKQAADFTVEDVESMNLPAMKVAIDSVTPNAWENYVNSNMRNFSSRTKKFMTALSLLSAEQRHELFGAALTGGEERSAESFIVGGKGLKLGDSLIRLDAMVDSQKDILAGLDAQGSNLMENPIVSGYQYESLDDPDTAATAESATVAGPEGKLTIDSLDIPDQDKADFQILLDSGMSVEQIIKEFPSYAPKQQKPKRKRRSRAEQRREQKEKRALKKTMENNDG